MSEEEKQTEIGVAQASDGLASRAPFRLILHIGAGKTGTSSIQETLKINRKLLQVQGIWYLGMMLEYSPIMHYPWQVASGYFPLIALKEKESTTQLVEALDSTLSNIKSRGGHTAIISNESLFHHYVESFFNAIKILHDKGWKVEVVVYVRRQDAWAKSAYIQWGLKHKAYKGELLPFSQWANKFPKQFFRFGENLHSWMQFPWLKCKVRNADCVGDVVIDFLALVGAKVDGLHHLTQQSNMQPSSEELLLRSLFNSEFPDTVRPQVFDQMMWGDMIDYKLSAQTFLDDYLPSEEELKRYLESHSADIEEVNRILAESDQQPLDTSTRNFKNKDVDLGKVVAALYKILIYSELKNNQGLSGLIKRIDCYWLRLKSKFQGYRWLK